MFALIRILFSIFCGNIFQTGRCTDPNASYLSCKPCAAINCGDTPPEVCIAVCQEPGCYCNKGYLRKNGKCVPENRC